MWESQNMATLLTASQMSEVALNDPQVASAHVSPTEHHKRIKIDGKIVELGDDEARVLVDGAVNMSKLLEKLSQAQRDDQAVGRVVTFRLASAKTATQLTKAQMAIMSSHLPQQRPLIKVPRAAFWIYRDPWSRKRYCADRRLIFQLGSLASTGNLGNCGSN